MKILAIDPGLERTGFAICDCLNVINSGIIFTSKTKTTKERIGQIFSDVSLLIDKYKPKKIILEKIFFFKNKKTIIEISQIHGVLILLSQQKKIDIGFLTPLQIKQIITGDGRADKKSVQKMLNLEFKIKKTKFDDESDAIACGLAYFLLNKD